jgi:DNA modification methylase
VEVTARFIVADVFAGLATLETGSVDLVVTSPPFLALRSYLPADHELKGKEIGSESTPAEFIDVLLRVTEELRRVLAPHGSICVELGDTYAGSSGAGGDYYEDGWREGQDRYNGNRSMLVTHADAWPLAKSKTLIPELYRIALAYGFNPLTGSESPAGKWRVRNNVTWCRPNPPVGALGDKWRPATSDLVVACVSDKRYWDDLATRKPHKADPTTYTGNGYSKGFPEGIEGNESMPGNPSGAPLLDYWEIPPTGYSGSHYAVFPPALVEPLVKAMAPPKVCRECGEPARRITEQSYVPANHGGTSLGVISTSDKQDEREMGGNGSPGFRSKLSTQSSTIGWTDCGHDNYRPALILDPFAGSGTTGLVATGYGHDAVLIDIDERNAVLAMERVGPFLMEIV